MSRLTITALLCGLTALAASADESADTLTAPYEAVDRGNAYFGTGDYESARQQYDEAVRLSPNLSVAHFNLGDAAFMDEDFVQAQRSFIEALKSDDPHLISRAQYNLGNVMFQRGLYGMRAFRDVIGPLKSAMSHYREALEIDPDFEDARYNLELAHRLIRQRQNETVQPDPNPRNRRQTTPDSKGLTTEDDRAQDASPSEREARAGKTEALLERLHKLAQITEAPAEGGSRSRPSDQPELPMTVNDANQLLDVTRERARVNRERRKQARFARLRDADVDKIW